MRARERIELARVEVHGPRRIRQQGLERDRVPALGALFEEAPTIGDMEAHRGAGRRRVDGLVHCAKRAPFGEHRRRDLDDVELAHGRMRGDGAGGRARAERDHQHSPRHGLEAHRQAAEMRHVGVVIARTRGAEVVGEQRALGLARVVDDSDGEDRVLVRREQAELGVLPPHG